MLAGSILSVWNYGFKKTQTVKTASGSAQNHSELQRQLMCPCEPLSWGHWEGRSGLVWRKRSEQCDLSDLRL